MLGVSYHHTFNKERVCVCWEGNVNRTDCVWMDQIDHSLPRKDGWGSMLRSEPINARMCVCVEEWGMSRPYQIGLHLKSGCAWGGLGLILRNREIERRRQAHPTPTIDPPISLSPCTNRPTQPTNTTQTPFREGRRTIVTAIICIYTAHLLAPVRLTD
jgi:hypothetical protein